MTVWIVFGLREGDYNQPDVPEVVSVHLTEEGAQEAEAKVKDIRVQRSPPLYGTYAPYYDGQTEKHEVQP